MNLNNFNKITKSVLVSIFLDLFRAVYYKINHMFYFETCADGTTIFYFMVIILVDRSIKNLLPK